jgi:hypothetical protein
LIALVPAAASAQIAQVHFEQEVAIPFRVDGNSPSVWLGDRLLFFTSDSRPVIASGPDLYRLGFPEPVVLDSDEHTPMWIESAWVDSDGTIYGWYHNEPRGVCAGDSLTAPRIGAVVSYDGGTTFHDLGIVLASGDAVDCGAKNGFFGGGHGDFSVILDREGTYFYFLFTSYGGSVNGQGIAIARMAFEDRANPAGAVFKYFNGAWGEPGIGGRITPIFRSRVSWQREDTDSFWGPAIHWNTYLEQYVMLLNYTCCEPGWPQRGIHVAFNPDLSKPGGWSTPALLLTDIPYGVGYYPQVMGLGPGENDTIAGQVARLYVHGGSRWLVVFYRPEDVPEAAPELPGPGSPMP